MTAQITQTIVKDVIRTGEVLQLVDGQFVVKSPIQLDGELLLIDDASMVVE